MNERDLGQLADRYGLSDDERGLLATYDRCLVETSAHTNLVARSSLVDRADRHYADSLQLWSLLPPRATSLLDVGSGAGFPGLVLACLARRRRPDLSVVLCDSVGKKAAFLAETARVLGLHNVKVESRRAEAMDKAFDVVTARAVTALPRLLDLTVPRLRKGGTLVLPKGRNAENELAEASERWRLNAERVGSHTDPDATILVITEPERLS